jgi:hypothetical protein
MSPGKGRKEESEERQQQTTLPRLIPLSRHRARGITVQPQLTWTHASLLLYITNICKSTDNEINPFSLVLIFEFDTVSVLKNKLTLPTFHFIDMPEKKNNNNNNNNLVQENGPVFVLFYYYSRPIKIPVWTVHNAWQSL